MRSQVHTCSITRSLGRIIMSLPGQRGTTRYPIPDFAQNWLIPLLPVGAGYDDLMLDTLALGAFSSSSLASYTMSALEQHLLQGLIKLHLLLYEFNSCCCIFFYHVVWLCILQHFTRHCMISGWNFQYFHGEFQDPKMEVRLYHISALFCRDIP